jgi:hypothetical protein
MSIVLPLHQQQKENTCALACLRMVLAAFGTEVAESEIEAVATMEEGGTLIDELERLARHFGLDAKIEETTPADLDRILKEGKLPIAYIDRLVFELNPRQRAKHPLRAAKVHAVIPIRLSPSSITFHDPLPPRITRRSLALFQEAHSRLGSHCVVCAKGQTGSEQT